MELASLRLLHILFGVFWAGGAICLGWFVLPAVNASGPAGGEVMRRIVDRKFPQLMLVAGFVTLITGLRLYMLRFSVAWVTTPEGIALTLGGLLGLGAFAIGLFAQRPTAMKLQALGAQIASGGGPPTEAQQAELQALKSRMQKLGHVLAAHLAGAVFLMSAMRLVLLLS